MRIFNQEPVNTGYFVHYPESETIDQMIDAYEGYEGHDTIDEALEEAFLGRTGPSEPFHILNSNLETIFKGDT